MYLSPGLALAGSAPVHVAGKAFSLPVWVGREIVRDWIGVGRLTREFGRVLGRIGLLWDLIGRILVVGRILVWGWKSLSWILWSCRLSWDWVSKAGSTPRGSSAHPGQVKWRVKSGRSNWVTDLLYPDGHLWLAIASGNAMAARVTMVRRAISKKQNNSHTGW